MGQSSVPVLLDLFVNHHVWIISTLVQIRLNWTSKVSWQWLPVAGPPGPLSGIQRFLHHTAVEPVFIKTLVVKTVMLPVGQAAC